MQRSGERVYGPYEQDGRFRVIVLRGDGTQRSKKFKSRAAADNFIDAVRGQAVGITMKQAADEYIKSLIDGGQKFGSYTRAEYHLKKLLQLETSGNRPIQWVRNRGQELYDAAKGKSVDTHRNALAAGKSWGRFCVKRKYLRVEPFADVVGTGRRRKGKPQHGIDEARALLDWVMSKCPAELFTPAAAVLTAQLLGPRASEVIDRDARDLDDGGRVIWIRDSKTENGKRMLEVPAVLQPVLRRLRGDRIGTVPLFVTDDGERPTRHWMYYWCKRICEKAGVPIITPQGFRGTHGSIAKRGGATGELVAAQLGHGSVTMTEGGAYVRKEAIEAAAISNVETLLVGKNPGKNEAAGKIHGG